MIAIESNAELLSCFSQVTYCGGYSGGEPPLPIPNREVKPAIADGTAPPGGRVGSCRSSRTRPEILAGSFRILPRALSFSPSAFSLSALLVLNVSALSVPFLPFHLSGWCVHPLFRRTAPTFNRWWKVVREIRKNGFILPLPVEGCDIFLSSRSLPWRRGCGRLEPDGIRVRRRWKTVRRSRDCACV